MTIEYAEVIARKCVPAIIGMMESGEAEPLSEKQMEIVVWAIAFSVVSSANAQAEIMKQSSHS